MGILQAMHADNRGDDETQFGFVYFNDGMRVLYTSARVGEELRYNVGDSSGGWGEVTETHRRLAEKFLRTGV